MDIFTQSLLGAASAQLGFRQRIGRDATWVAALAAYSPDLDVFTPMAAKFLDGQANIFTHLAAHRGITHSLLAVPLIAAIFALPWWAIRNAISKRQAAKTETSPPARPIRFGLLFACCFVAVLTHSLLDWCTSYGTQLFAPFSSSRLALDAIAIVDIIYTPLLIATLIGCWVAGKVAPNKPGRARLIVALVGLILSTGYIATGRLLHNRAVDIALAGATGKTIVSADAYPMLGSIFLWRGVVETDDTWLVTRIHHFARAGTKRATNSIAKTPNNLWLDKARQLNQYQLYHWFAAGRLREEFYNHPDMFILRFHDMRYGRNAHSIDSLWPLEVQFAPDGELLSAKRRFADIHNGRSFISRLRAVAQSAWMDIWNP